MAKHFNKIIINFWLDCFLLTAFLLLCWSSVVVRYVFPAATNSEGWQLWGLSYLVWTDIQFSILCVFAFGVLLHLMLHWAWVCGVVENWRRKRLAVTTPRDQDSGSRTLWGVGLLIAICNVLGFAVAIAALSIQGPTP